jgi:ubiquinone/menaquinone biosynthesis C-methylase UbiE
MTRLTAVATLPLFICTGCGGITRSLYNNPWRARWQQPEVVIRSLALQPGDHVADLGAGGGYFTFRLADAVGSHGKVYAVDIDKSNLDYIARRAQRDGYTNIETILAKPDDPLLPTERIDMIFTCNTYHHLWKLQDTG